MSKLSWRVAAVTDCGTVRRENQDNYYVSEDTKMLVLADGMGGARDGSVASRLAVETVKNKWSTTKPERLASCCVQEWLIKAVSDANQKIFGVSEDVHTHNSMGTTIVVAAHTDEDKLEIAHVGDSRAYLIRNGQAQMLTQDHSVVWEMYLRGQLTKEQAFSSIYRNLLTRCLGHNPDVEVDETGFAPRPGDWVIICSDGLNSVLRDEVIAKIVSKCKTPDDVCERLLKRTLSDGANDNVTIIAVQYLEANC